MKIFKLIADLVSRISCFFFDEKKYIKKALAHEPHGTKAEEEDRAQKLKQNIKRAFFNTSFVFILSLITVGVFHYFDWHLKHNILFVTRWIAYAIILLGVLSPVGWRIRTYSGETLTEILDEEWHRTCYAVAAYLLATSYLLE